LNVLDDSLYSIIYKNFVGDAKINNSYYYTGYTFYDNNEDSLTGGTNSLFWKTDTNFNKISSNSIGGINYPDVCEEIQAGFDNNLLLGGLTMAHAPGSVIGINRTDWYLVNIDTAGQVLGEYYYGITDQCDVEGIKAMSKGADSTYFLAGLFHNYYDIPLGMHYYVPVIVKLNRQFQTIWEKEYSEPLSGVIVSDMHQTSDGNQAILIQRIPEELFLNFFIQTIYSKIIKFNNDGNVLWSRNYYKGDTNTYIRYRAWDLIETKDSGFAFCGSAIDTANAGPNQSTWLVKTDSLGCDGYQSCNDTALFIQPFQIPDTLCLNDTNWVTIEINGRSAPFKLTLSNGQEFDSIYYPNTAPPHIFYDMPVYPTIVDSNWQLIITLTDPWGADITDTLYFVVHDCGTVIANDYYVENKIKIYPNPAEDIVNVQIRGRLDNDINISLYNSDGSLCKSLKANSTINQINLSNLAPGLYFIKVQGIGFVKTEKIVLE
ncbi:MAG: T9SS type A sorting domain-containing protein, partial [Bacteroidota bacterium]